MKVLFDEARIHWAFQQILNFISFWKQKVVEEVDWYCER